jgi:uncharacterized membrane protein
LWVVPVLAYVTSLIAIRIVGYVDDWLEWSWQWKMEVVTVQSLLQGLVAAPISSIVFAFSSLLVASSRRAQLSPRIIATTLLRDNTIRLLVALFVLTLSFGLGTLARSQTQVQYLLLTCAVILAGTSTVAFIYLIDYAARLLRPVSIVWRLGEQGLLVIEEVYPAKIKGRHISSKPHPPLGAPDRIVVHHGVSAIILALDLETLRLEAERTNGITRVCPPGRRLPCGGGAAVPVVRRGRRGGRSRAARGGCDWPGAHHRAGRDFRVPGHRGHRHQGAVEGNQ